MLRVSYYECLYNNLIIITELNCSPLLAQVFASLFFAILPRGFKVRSGMGQQ